MHELSPYVRQPTNPSATDRFRESSDSPLNDTRIIVQNFLQLVRKRQRLILQIFLGVLLTTVAVVFTRTPIYTAKTVLLIERQAPRALDIREVVSPQLALPDEYDYYKTQFEVLRSEGLAAKVISQQALETDRYFALSSPEQSSFSWLGSALASVRKVFHSNATMTKIPDDQLLGVDPRVIAKYLQELTIDPVQKTRLVAISFSAPDPSLSARIANAHAEAFIQQGVELRSRATEDARNFLEGKLVELKKRVEDSESALNLYRQQQGILSLDDRENVVVGRLVDLNKLLTEAEAERIGLEAQVRLVRKRDFGSLPSVLSNTLIQTLRAQLTTIEGEYAALAAQFKPGFPRLDQLKAQLDETRNRLNVEIQKAVDGIESLHLTAAAKEQELRQKMVEQKNAALNLKNASVEFAILSREVDTNRQLYDSVLQRIKEIGVATDSYSSNITVVDKATPPIVPSKPKKVLSLLFGSLLGLLGGIGLASVLEYLDNTVKSPEDVQRLLRLPNFAVVPDFLTLPGYTLSPNSGDGLAEEVRKRRRVTGDQDVSTLTTRTRRRTRPSRSLTLVTPGISSVSLPANSQGSSPNPFSIILESYRTLRTAILLSRANEPPKTLLFTSGIPGEGKSVTILNTAIVLAQMGARVLLIDADLRRPRCHELLSKPNKRGLTELLTGQRDFDEVIQSTKTSQLSFISGGLSVPPDPVELLGSQRMHAILVAAQKQYDYVLIDSPPVMPVSDAILLATMVDGVILVIDSQKTPRYIVKETQARLDNVQARILGVVLNKMDMQKSSFAFYYGDYVSYYPSIDNNEKSHVSDETKTSKSPIDH